MQKVRKKSLPSDWRKRKLKILAFCIERIKKSWCKRHPDHLCRWAYWYQRSDCCRFPRQNIKKMYRSSGKKYLQYVPDKDKKAFATDLKTIYQVADEKKVAALNRVTEKWTPKYPNSMKRWKDNWDAISPIFKFSATVRKVIYTTNAIESLNSTYRKLNRQRSVFPSDTALLKALYLATFEATKKWTAMIRNWAQVYGELSIMYEGRLPE